MVATDLLKFKSPGESSDKYCGINFRNYPILPQNEQKRLFQELEKDQKYKELKDQIRPLEAALGECKQKGLRAETIELIQLLRPFYEALDVYPVNKRIRDTLVNTNLRLVADVVEHLIKKSGRLRDFFRNDLFQEGAIGLQKAVNRYDYQRGERFTTYAYYWIRASIQRAVMLKGSAIKIPVHEREKIRNFLDIKNKLAFQLGREPKNQEVAEVIRMPVKEIIEFKRIMGLNRIFSLDAALESKSGESDDRVLADIIADGGKSVEEIVEERVDNESRRKDLNESLQLLDPRTQKIIAYRFGLDDGKEKTLKETGKNFHLTRSRIHQIEIEVIKRLKNNYRVRLLAEDFISWRR